MIKLKNIINESNVEDKFGKLLFGQLKQFHKGEFEIDTKMESDIFQNLLLFIRGEYTGKQASSYIVKSFNLLMKYKNDFPKELKYKSNKSLYRGIKMSEDKLKTLNLNNNNVKSEKINGRLYRVISYIYKPHDKIQSWTTEFSVANHFGIDGVILRANIPEKETLFSKILLNAIGRYLNYNRESEVIRVGGKIETDLILNDNVYRSIFGEPLPKWKSGEKLKWNDAPTSHGKNQVEFRWFNRDNTVHVIIKGKKRPNGKRYKDKEIDISFEDLLKQNT